jgi:predicted nucleic acid-binding protein
MAWAEFLCGPVPGWAAEETAELFGEPVPFDGIDATVAAQLFNTTGRRRGTMVDCMIASVAVRADAALATANIADFRRFTPFGLTVVSK